MSVQKDMHIMHVVGTTAKVRRCEQKHIVYTLNFISDYTFDINFVTPCHFIILKCGVYFLSICNC